MAEYELITKCKNCNKPIRSKNITMFGVTKQLSIYCEECAKKLEEEENEEYKQTLNNLRKELKSKCLLKSNIPIKYQDATFDTFEKKYQKEAFSLCKTYAENYINNIRKSLILLSPKSWGIGKTHLVCAIANHIIDNITGGTPPIYFITQPDLFNRIRDTFGKDKTETEYDVIKELTTVPLLIIDDVGKEDRQDMRFVQKTMFNIIDGRYRNLLPIIMTANLSENELSLHLGGDNNNMASFDRLVEMTNQEFLIMSGQTYRSKIQQSAIGKNNKDIKK